MELLSVVITDEPFIYFISYVIGNLRCISTIFISEMFLPHLCNMEFEKSLPTYFIRILFILQICYQGCLSYTGTCFIFLCQIPNYIYWKFFRGKMMRKRQNQHQPSVGRWRQLILILLSNKQCNSDVRWEVTFNYIIYYTTIHFARPF